MADGTVKVNFLGDASSLKRATDESNGHLSSLGSSIGKFAKVAAVGLGAVAVGMGAFAKSAISAAEESIKVSAQTEAVIKSTGAAAQVTAKQVSALATAISNKTGIDDEAIQSGQNLLLTFTELQNRAGKGNDIFDQATQVMVDMSAAMGQDASSTAIQLGKALNDPIKGISALTRVGVTFSAEQKKQIKVMQEAGDIAGAQKVILAELTKEFGGSAAAQATSAQKMKVAFGNLQEQIGTMLIPVVEKVSKFLSERVIPALSALAERVKPIAEEWIPKLRVAFQEAFDWIEKHVPPVLAAIGEFITTKVIPALQELWGWVQEKLVPALGKMATSFREEIWPVLEEKVLPALGKLAIFIKEEVLPILGKIVVFIVAELIPAFFKIVNWIAEVLIPKIAEITVAFWHFVIDVRDVVNRVIEVFSGIAEGIYAPFKWAFNEIAKLWNNTVGKLSFSIPGWVPGIGGNGWDVPDIPTLHSGGMFNSGRGQGLALLQDGERVLPVGRSAGTTVIFEVDGKVLARAVVNESNNTGGLPIRIRAAS